VKSPVSQGTSYTYPTAAYTQIKRSSTKGVIVEEEDSVSVEPVVDQAAAQDLSDRERAVRSLLSRDVGAALHKALESPPLSTRDVNVKDKNADIVLEVLNSTKESQLSSVVSDLSLDEQDLLMKYIYRGLAKPIPNGALFKWHAAVLTRGGIGCVVRSIADKRTV
jgi:actin related protein 2/3 complex subunit 5